MKPERIALYIQVMMDLANNSGVGYGFTDERRLNRRGGDDVPRPSRPYVKRKDLGV